MKLALLALLATATEAVRLRHKTVKTLKPVTIPSFAQAFSTMKTKQPAEPTDKEVFASFDVDGDGEIDFDEFVTLISVVMMGGELVPSEALPELQAVFDVADANGSGGIDFDEAMAAKAAFEEEE